MCVRICRELVVRAMLVKEREKECFCVAHSHECFYNHPPGMSGTKSCLIIFSHDYAVCQSPTELRETRMRSVFMGLCAWFTIMTCLEDFEVVLACVNSP